MAGQKTDEIAKQVREFIGGLTMKQRALIVGGALLVAATVWVFTHFLAAPEMKTLYSGLKSNDIQTIASKLEANKIPYEISSDGTSLSVPADQLDRGRMETAAQGLPRNARLGFEIFDTPNWMGTEFTEKVNYQRAMEGELERTIQTMSEVDAVRVHLVMPEESLFTDREREAKAAVILKTHGGLSPEKQFAIAQLVASAVDKMRPENVTVLDAETSRPMRSLEPGATVGSELGDQLSQQLVTTLEPVVGVGKVRATVRVEYDSSSFEDTQETYDPKSAVAINTQKTEESSGADAVGGVPGTASNLPGEKTPVQVNANGTDRQLSRSEAGTYVVNKSVRHTVQPSGRVRRVTAAVIVDDSVVPANGGAARRQKRTPEEMKNLEQIASAAIGLDASRGDVLALENLSFEEKPEEAIPLPTKVEKVRTLVSKWSGAFRYVAVGLLFLAVYLTLLRPVKKQVLAAFRELPSKIGTRALTPAPVAELINPEELSETKRISGLKKELLEKVKSEPMAASKLVQSWIRET